MKKVAVVGAGIIGLSTAINIIQQNPNVQVTVIADKFEKETTSIGAGAIFRPNARHTPGTPVHLIRRWSEKTWRHFSNLSRSNMSSVTGCCVAPGYIFSHTRPETALYEDIVYSCRQMTDKELANIGMDRYKFGFAITTIIITMPKYMPWLINRFKELGGKVIKRKLYSFEELQGDYDVVVNCAALGNRELGDKGVYPVRGQLVRVAAPWIKHWVHNEEGAYILPNTDVVVLGALRQKDNYNLEVDEKDTAGILERCYRLWPALQGANIVDVWVGLRPVRSPVRLEKEIRRLPSGELKIVHNYGHGANGVAMSWGSGKEAAEMVREILSPHPQAKL